MRTTCSYERSSGDPLAAGPHSGTPRPPRSGRRLKIDFELTALAYPAGGAFHPVAPYFADPPLLSGPCQGSGALSTRFFWGVSPQDQTLACCSLCVSASGVAMSTRRDRLKAKAQQPSGPHQTLLDLMQSLVGLSVPKGVTGYLESARVFERLAAGENNPDIRKKLLEQAEAYYSSVLKRVRAE